jgi:hypothetical protein
MTFTWQRRPYDWYRERLSGESTDEGVSWPVIMDADGIIADLAVVVRYCEIIGIDPVKLKFEWTPVTDSEKAKIGNPAVEKLLSCLFPSSGIQKYKVAINIDISAEAVNW